MRNPRILYSRKAQQQQGIGVLTTIILVLVSSLIIIALGMVIFNHVNSTTWKDICRASIAKKQVTSIGGIVEREQRLECPTQYMQVRDDGIYKFIRGKFRRIKDFKKATSVDQKKEVIQHAIAQEWADWSYALQISPFGEFKNKFRCMILTEITFDDKVKTELGGTISKFNVFLNDNTIYSQGEAKTYSEYLMGGKFEGQMDIDLNSEYTFVYYAFKNALWANVLKGVSAGGTAGCLLAAVSLGTSCVGGSAIGAVVGAANHFLKGEETPAIILTKSTDDFINKCDRLY